MKNPNPINLQTSAEVRKAGWQAETRDTDGHLCRAHAPFETDEDIVWLVREALEHGETITIWPSAHPDSIARIVSARMAGGEGVVDAPSPQAQMVGSEAAIRKAGQVAIDHLIDTTRIAEAGPDDLEDYLTRIVDACVRAALSTATPPVSAREGETSPQAHVVGCDRSAVISALQEWSDQKYGSPFSISACNDLIGVLQQHRVIADVDEVSRAKCRLAQQLSRIATKDISQHDRDVQTLIAALASASEVEG